VKFGGREIGEIVRCSPDKKKTKFRLPVTLSLLSGSRRKFVMHVLQMPLCEDDWLKISSDFTARCNLPHCLGALDGKHISILPPPNCGSLYYNYKRFFSLVLLALVDSHCRFIYVDIGAYGRTSDGGVYNNSSLAAAVENGELHLPPSSTIPGTDRDMPYVIVGDDAFTLKPYLLKPYALRNLTEQQRIFNYRFSRARRTEI